MGPGDTVAAMLTRRLGTSAWPSAGRPGHDGVGYPHLTGGRRDLLTAFRSAAAPGRHRPRVRRGCRRGPAGRALEAHPRRDGGRHETAWSRAIGSRVVDCSRRALMHQLEHLVARLRTDHVDVGLAQHLDDPTPIEETVSALVWAVETGRARYVGVSNHVGWQAARTMSLLAASGVPMVANSVECRLVTRAPSEECVDLWRPGAWGCSRGHRWGEACWPGLRTTVSGRLAPGVGGVRAVRRSPRRRPHPRRGRGGAHGGERPRGGAGRGRARLGARPARGHGADPGPPHPRPSWRCCSTQRPSSCPSRSCTPSTRCRSTTPERGGPAQRRGGSGDSSRSSSYSMSSSSPA